MFLGEFISMDWELVNGITGIVSAICAIFSLVYFNNVEAEIETNQKQSTILSKYQLMSFMLFCSGWCLLCLAFLWIAEPYGVIISDREYLNFFGFLISLPAIIILFYSFKLLDGKYKT